MPSAEQLERAATSFFLGRTLFREFGADTYAFRRSLLAGSGLLNGLMEFNPLHHTVVVHGRLALFSAAFVVWWFVWAFTTGFLEMVGMGVLVMAALLGVDYLYMQRTLSIAVKVWSEPTA